jgi:hypothetical protein
MVMSVAASSPRGYCIRCGGIEFHVIHHLVVRRYKSEFGEELDADNVNREVNPRSRYTLVACIADGSDI